MMARMQAFIRCFLHLNPGEKKLVKRDTINDMFSKQLGYVYEKEMSDEEFAEAWGQVKFVLETAYQVEFK